MIDNVTAIGERTEGNLPDRSSTLGNGELSQNLQGVDSSGIDVPKTAAGLTEAAQEYTEKISDAVAQAKDYVGGKMSTVTEKIKEFASNDLSGLADKAKVFARENPGQAILVSVAAGMLLGLVVRGRR